MDKSSSNGLLFDWKDQPYSIDYLQSTLDRIIGFVNSCDVKASIVLGIFGIVVGGLLSDSILTILLCNLNLAIGSDGLFAPIFLVLFGLSSISILTGLFFLISAISAKTKLSKKDSKIYFVDIAANATEEAYRKKLVPLKETDVSADLISQIYINSKICTKKYRHYNFGLLTLAIGIVVFLLDNLAAYNIFA